MTPSDNTTLETYLPVYDVIPEEWEPAREFITENLRRIGMTMNVREIGSFLDQETLTGQQFVPSVNTPQGTFRSVLRKVVDIGTLPNAGTKSVPHGINFDNRFTLTNLYIAATDPVNLLAFSLQYWSNDAGDDIRLNMDATNINVVTLTNYTTYTRCFAIVEYIQEL